MISTRLKECLDNAGVAYARHAHTPAYTSQEIAQAVHVPGEVMVKSVILKADEGPLVMAVLSANDTVNMDVLREEIGCDNLRLATENEFRDAFPTCKTGAMPPIGSLFDVPTYCEQTLSRDREIEFNGGSHDETIRMEFDDFMRLAKPRMAHFAGPYREHPQRMSA